MTYANLRAALKALCPATYRRAAPAGSTRYIVTSRYGGSWILGDGVNLRRLPRVQIDVYWQAEDDALPDLVCQLLTVLDLGFDLVDEIYDEDLALYRLILQLEVDDA